MWSAEARMFSFCSREALRKLVEDFSVSLNLQINVNLCAIVELADGLGVAFLAVVLSIDLIVDRGESGEAICALLADNVGLHGVGAGVGEVDDRADYGIILLIEHLAVEKAALRFVFVVGKSVGHSNREQKRAGDEDGFLACRMTEVSLICLSRQCGELDLIHSGSSAQAY